jgi:hypothetical protein
MHRSSTRVALDPGNASLSNPFRVALTTKTVGRRQLSSLKSRWSFGKSNCSTCYAKLDVCDRS